MKKEDIIKELEKGLYWEDDFIKDYDNSSFWTLVEGDVSKELFEKIKQLFSKNIKDTKKHKEMISKLIEKLKKSDKNEY